MFEEIREKFYESLIKSIEDRKKCLKLKREEMLNDPTRISKILHGVRNEHCPYLICKGEYAYLYYLFLCEDHDSFIREDILNCEAKKHEKRNGKNYDKMLWGHIDWDKMFQDVITELSELDISEEMGKLFEDTLVDYAPYANIRYDEIPYEYARIYIPPDERAGKRRDAIKWVHLRRGSGLFKQIFSDKFSGKTLCEFDKKFPEFVSDYLEKRKPNGYSLGLQAYNFHQTISRTVAHWRSLDGVRHGDMSDEESDFEPVIESYYNNGRKQMKMFEEYQEKFDKLHIDIE